MRDWRAHAERGDAQAQFKLGLAYADGQGVARDQSEAVRWWRAAAGQDHVKAQVMLGFMHYEGRGVDRDLVEALMWLVIAAARGNRDARQGEKTVAALMEPEDVAEARRRARTWLAGRL